MSRGNQRWLTGAWLFFISLLSSSAWADTQLNLTKGVTAVSREVYDLHMLVLYICTAIGVVVFGALHHHLDAKITNKFSDGPGGRPVDAPY